MKTGLRFLAALSFFVMAASPGFARDLKINAFYGLFEGTGVAENRDSIYFGVTVRDFDVSVKPAGEGFEVEWTTVIRRGGDPNNPKVKRKGQKFTFLPSGRAGIYRSPASADPISGATYAWARISGNTLNVYLFTITASGAYSMQSYARTLTPLGMDFVFTRLRDGEPVRSVKGKLIKYAK
jgi:hypothetical protein